MTRYSPSRLLTGTAAAALLLSACSDSTEPAGDQTPAEGGELIIAAVAEPENVTEPVVDGSLAGYNYYYNVFDRLTMFDAEGQMQPELATEWEPNEDFTEWTYTIRDDVTFHDGEELTVDDVIFTYNEVLNSTDSSVTGYLNVLDTVEAGEEENTLIFTLNTSFSAFPSLTTAVSIVPEHVYSELGSEEFAQQPVGSGPFQFVSYTRGVEYVIERNEDYWGGAPSLERVTFQTVSDQDARLNGVISGSVDLGQISPNQVGAVADDPNIVIESVTSNGVVFLGVNTGAEGLDDPLVRQAIIHAVDRESIVENVLTGGGLANGQIVAQSVGGYDDSVQLPAYDPELAEQLLAEADYQGETITLEYATDGRIPLSTEVAQAIQGYLTAVGISVEMSGMDQSTLSNRVSATQDLRGLFLNTWAPSTMDGDMPATNFFCGGSNDYTHDETACGLVEAQREVDEQERTDVFGELAELNIEQGFIMPLYSPDNIYAANPNLDWQPRADGLFVLKDASLTE
ncbi:ABC transporter substrate-binding protein [Nesterenkonia alkaliphila]|uniref:ABC transporter substrate-binding protein n=1 Tax=Nesterenkonia alkaliphila TaxID=1463631 RepID=UPI0012F9334C|nr:ABC transporter substrate-binding protein [Nesterenkonia alkaliphila]